MVIENQENLVEDEVFTEELKPKKPDYLEMTIQSCVLLPGIFSYLPSCQELQIRTCESRTGCDSHRK